MTITLMQLWGMIRYEALMQWRRRTIVILCVFFAVSVVGLSSMIDSMNPNSMRLETVQFEGDSVTITSRDPQTGMTIETTLTGDDAAAVPRVWEGINLSMMQSTWSLIIVSAPGIVILLLTIAATTNDIIPIDRQYNVRELTLSTPLTNATYLMGKLLSVWMGLLIGLPLTMLLIGLYAHFRIGALDAWLLIRMWALNLIPTALIAAGFPVLIGGLAFTRRGASRIFLPMFLIPLALWIAVIGINQGYLKNPILSAAGENDFGSYDAAVEHILTGTLTDLLPYLGVLIGVGVLVWWVERSRSR